MEDEVFIARQAGDADGGGDALVHGSEPPRTRAAHAHAGGADALRVHLGALAQVIERDLVVAHHHAPDRAAEPQVQFQEAVLRDIRVGNDATAIDIGRAAGDVFGAVAVIPRVRRDHDVTGPNKRLAEAFRIAAGRDQRVLVGRGGMQPENRGRGLLPLLRHQHQRADVGRARNLDLRVAPDDDGVAVMPVVTPAPDDGFPHDHEGRDFIERDIHPVGLERRSVSAFVPARIRTRAVEHGIDQEGNRGPPTPPECDGEVPGDQEQRR